MTIISTEPGPSSKRGPLPGLPPDVRQPPIQELEPEKLPDEIPNPNPDENEEPPKHLDDAPIGRFVSRPRRRTISKRRGKIKFGGLSPTRACSRDELLADANASVPLDFLSRGLPDAIGKPLGIKGNSLHHDAT